jgi:hypothetical protein
MGTALADLGYRVIIIRFDGSLADQVRQNTDVFGPGLQGAAVPAGT